MSDRNKPDIVLEGYSAAARREEILQRLKKTNEVSVHALAADFHVSDMTIRRDLHRLEEQGLLTVHYGGATLRKNHPNMVDFSDRSDTADPYKRAIAHTAAGYIQPDDVIYLDTSTTILSMLSFLPDCPFTVVTNALPVLQQLYGLPQIRLVMAPGVYQPQYGGSADYATVKYLGQFHYHKAFFGASAVDAAFGASATREVEAAIKRSVFSAADQTYLLADHTKFGRKNYMCYNAVRDYTKIFTDSQLDESQRAALAKQGAALIFCN